jgi:hypothetical protein
MKRVNYLDIYDFLKEEAVTSGCEKFGHRLFSFYKLKHAKMQQEVEDGHANNNKYQDIKKDTNYSMRQISRIKNKRIGKKNTKRKKKKKP